MPTVTTIIPVHNLIHRKIDRIINTLWSLEYQETPPEKVVIVDSSNILNFRTLNKAVQEFGFIQHIHAPVNGFNMPILFNRGIKEAKTEYIHCIGADFLFRSDYYKTFLEKAHPDCFLITASGRLKPRNIQRITVERWAFPRSVKPSAHGAAACGLQFFHKSFPERFGGYDERFSGWSGMDEEYYWRAKKSGMDCQWITDTLSLHQYHTPSKNAKIHLSQRKKNWALMKRIKEGIDTLNYDQKHKVER